MAGSPRPKLKIYAGLKGILLFLLPLPLLFTAVGSLWDGHLWSFTAAGGSYALFLAGALIARLGIVKEIEYTQRPLARARPLPLKTLSALILGIATAVAAHFAAGQEIGIAFFFGIGTVAGFFMYYGFDPKENKTFAGADGITREEMSEALSEAYGKLDRINQARRGISSREFQNRLGFIASSTEKILETIERDPRDLRRARKFLHVYLDGIQKVTEQYAETHKETNSTELEQNYRVLLADMEKVCKEQHEKLLRNDVFDLDVQIEVLSTRLKREGLV
jgi:5-bromo-4-chloroindolyl phosphate hydrolysis protein